MSEELNINEKLQELDAKEELANYYVQRAKDYEKLLTRPEFKSVILEGYLEVEEQNVFDMLTSVFTNKDEVKESLHMRLEMIRAMKVYLGTNEYVGTIRLDADKYKEELKAIEARKAELHAMEVTDGSN